MKQCYLCLLEFSHPALKAKDLSNYLFSNSVFAAVLAPQGERLLRCNLSLQVRRQGIVRRHKLPSTATTWQIDVVEVLCQLRHPKFQKGQGLLVPWLHIQIRIEGVVPVRISLIRLASMPCMFVFFEPKV